MNKGFTLLEMAVTLLIVGILAAVALPYYLHSVENAKMTEVVLLWGRQKNFASGKHLTPEQAQRYTEQLQKANLKYFTGRVICNGTPQDNPPCWEAEFTLKNENASVHYKLQTMNNFMQLGCMGLNANGTEFCQNQAENKTPTVLPDGDEIYLIR